MEYIKVFVIKGIMIIIILYLIFGLGFCFIFGDVLLMIIVLGVVFYFMGDFYVLLRWNNIMVVFVDFGIVFFVVWLMGMLLFMGILGGRLVFVVFIFVIIIVVGEYFFYIYLMRKDLGGFCFLEF